MSKPLLAESRIGGDLQHAARSDFFRYFHMRVDRSVEVADGVAVYLRPDSTRFRERVAVIATVDRAGRFQSLSLMIDRSVIDDGTSETEARDIVKSFLADATPLKDVTRILDWVADIRGRPGLTAQLVAKRDEVSADDALDLVKMQLEEGKPVTAWLGKPLQLPEVPSDGFAVFIGETEACERRLADSIVRLANEIVDGKKALRVSVFPSGAE